MARHCYFFLPPNHYAHQWDKNNDPTPMSLEEMTEMGRAYVLANEEEKKDILFRILESFHFFLTKYVKLILFGHIPQYKGYPDKDLITLVRYFAPAGMKTRKQLLPIAKMLHLSFKQQSPAEIYDVMCTCMIKAINGYDPFYVDKVREVVALVSSIETPTFEASELKCNFKSSKILRMLARKGHIQIQDKVGKEETTFAKADWPPPKKFLNSTPIGLTYHIQRWFGFYVQHYLESAMSIVENRKDFMQLNYFEQQANMNGRPTGLLPSGSKYSHTHFGSFQNMEGVADLSLVNKNLDLSSLTLDWVKQTADPLFKNLSVDDRFLIFQVFAKEANWTDLGKTLQVNPKIARGRFEELMSGIKKKAGIT